MCVCLLPKHGSHQQAPLVQRVRRVYRRVRMFLYHDLCRPTSTPVVSRYPPQQAVLYGGGSAILCLQVVIATRVRTSMVRYARDRVYDNSYMSSSHFFTVQYSEVCTCARKTHWSHLWSSPDAVVSPLFLLSRKQFYLRIIPTSTA